MVEEVRKLSISTLFRFVASRYAVSALLASFPGSLGVWREESLVYTVCACANSGGIPPAPVTIPYTIGRAPS